MPKYYQNIDNSIQVLTISTANTVQQHAHLKCDCGVGICRWTAAAQAFFERNPNIDERQLASATAAILHEGPWKTRSKMQSGSCRDHIPATSLQGIREADIPEERCLGRTMG